MWELVLTTELYIIYLEKLCVLLTKVSCIYIAIDSKGHLYQRIYFM